MLNFASIRFAVNVCVIGALLLPSSGVALVSAGATCGVAESGPAKCPGCGHCEVSQSGDRCGCCSEAQEPPHGGCCELTAVKKETSDSQWGVCLCGDQPLPQVPAPQHRSATEQLVRVVMMAPATLAVATMDSSVVPSIEEASVPPSLLPRDSQRRLGIWLI